MKKGCRYQTNLVIVTDTYEKEFVQNTLSIYANAAEEIFTITKKILPKIQQLALQEQGYDENRILFAILNIAMVKGYGIANDKSPVGPPQELAWGGKG